MFEMMNEKSSGIADEVASQIDKITISKPITH